MSWKQGWFAIRESKARAIRRLRAVELGAPEEAAPASFGVGSRADSAWTSFDLRGGSAYGHVFDWAQAVSAPATEGPVLVMGFFILEGMWSWGCFAEGKHVAGMAGFPHRYPMLLGDIEAAAALLAVPPELLSDYCVGHPFADVDQEEAYLDTSPKFVKSIKAFLRRSPSLDASEIGNGMASLEHFRVREGDEFHPWDEYGFLDFARRLGIPEPEGEGLALAPRGVAGEWKHSQLSPEEDVVFTFDPAAFRATHLGA